MFFQKELGLYILKEGIRPTKSRVEAIQNAPAPQNKVELQSFLGMLRHQEAFPAAKKILCEDSQLVHFDVKKPVKLFCDASAYGVGACLVHVMPNSQERPVAYASRTLTAAERITLKLSKRL